MADAGDNLTVAEVIGTAIGNAQGLSTQLFSALGLVLVNKGICSREEIASALLRQAEAATHPDSAKIIRVLAEAWLGPRSSEPREG